MTSPKPFLIRTRLLFRFAALTFIYCAQLALLLLPIVIVTISILMAMVRPGYTMGSEYYPWLYLNILACCAPLGILMQRFFHPEEFYFYANHSLGRRHLWPVAILFSLLIAGLGALALYVQDGRVKFSEIWQSAHVYWFYNQNLLHSYLKLYPWMLWGLIGIVSVLGLIVLIWLLSSGESLIDSENPDFELKIDSTLHQIKQRSVLKGAWLNCKSAQLIGLLGRNGCGKSTLFKIIFGTLKADFSVLKINEGYVKKAFLIPGLIAYLPQTPFLPRHLKVKQVIRLFTGQSDSELFHDLRLKKLLKQKVSELSGGERRYLELHLMLALQRHFLLLDEPFSELEPLYKAGCAQLIQKQAQQGTGIIVSDHDYNQIISISETLMLMHAGQTRMLQSAKDLKGFYLPE